MPRKHRGTSQAGYGWAHQKARARLLRDLIDGTPCAHCGRPMHHWQKLQADHSRPRSLGGQHADRLLHAACNLSRGAALGNRLRGLARHRHTSLAAHGSGRHSAARRPHRLPEW